ncbi:MAG: ISAs1 family transposase, partial [Pseudogulbenkiania sp.]|nr:ISAs1 family transposase [Pseudogulbenkiania sp.]
CYISSRELTAEELARAARAHWGIENQLHWVMDVGFGEDACMVRKDNAAQNLSLLRKIVLNLVRPVPMGRNGKMSMRTKRKSAAWDDDTRAMLLGLTAL